MRSEIVGYINVVPVEKSVQFNIKRDPTLKTPGKTTRVIKTALFIVMGFISALICEGDITASLMFGSIAVAEWIEG